MIACPFDEILLWCCGVSIFYFCVNKYRKWKGLPPLHRRCKHQRSKR